MKKIVSMTVLWIALSGAARATTIYVAADGDDARTGLGDWTNAVLTISNGVAKATSLGDLVMVSTGKYSLTAEVVVGNGITVRSWHDGVVDATNTIVDGQSAARCFNITHAGAVVEGFTIRNGSTSADGGGVIMTKGLLSRCIVVSNSTSANGGGIRISTTAQLVDCDVAYNAAKNGGGVSLSSSGTVLDGCRIFGNAATTEGGGIYCATYSFALITNCVLTANVSNGHGGGIKATRDTIARCLIVGNQQTNTSAHGGGVYMTGETAGPRPGNIVDCTIQNNYSAYYGGGVGILNNPASVNIRNCLISGNRAKTGGGGVAAFYGRNTVESCTITSNRVVNGLYGGGIYVAQTNHLLNCIVYFNTVSSGASSNYHDTGASSFTNCCFAPALAGASVNYSTNNIVDDPRFMDRDSGNYRLAWNSPCVNAGMTQAWMMNALDLDEQPRLDSVGGHVDIGCYEYLRRGTAVYIR